MTDHVSSVHEVERPLKCEVCKAKFTEKSKITDHVCTVHEGKNLKVEVELHSWIMTMKLFMI